ncbi:sterigmatocystin 8-O-methyltransferase [Clohesyomyces aquaticus]|uniref:Sterigmatocystin 8-O-methyltransferase n=1 Tax=Clohesyomyces aquaticus TaxID=1231657 RepID=A0A1Y1ZJX6_9PLEO|nr:sterigmatocystin 8-O-methyltransferase [Clohesyomyces aquaticus]
MPSIVEIQAPAALGAIQAVKKLPSKEANGHSSYIQPNAPSSNSTLEQYVQQILQNTGIITEYLETNGLPQPSFERDAPESTLPESAPETIRAARVKLMDAALKAFQLALGPKEYIPNIAVGLQYIVCLRWLTHFGIFASVPLKGSISYDDLALAAKVSRKQLKTVARMAMTSALFCEPKPNHLAHTATSALLVTNESLHDWAVFMSEGTVPAASKLVEASERWPDSEQKNQTAYNIAFNTDLPFFDHLKTQPDKTRQFASYMKNVQKSEGTALRHLVNGFDWESLGKATVVDVGGSSGASSITLAESFSNLNFIVQDLPENAAEGQTSISALSANIKNRIYFQGHNFFEEQPFKGAQAYLLRMILHDWPANEATCILKNLVPALNKGARILIMDTVLPRPGTLPSSQERLLRVRDMTMLQAFNSLERDLEDWKDVLAAADPRLSIAGVTQPAGSVMSMIEVVFDV